MKLSEAPTKVIGVQVGELAIDLIRSGVPALKVRIAMFTDAGVVGFMDIADKWSKKSMDAMQAFIEALEEDALEVIFKVPQSSEPAAFADLNEPLQF